MNLVILFSGQGLQKPEHLQDILRLATAQEKQLFKEKLPELFSANLLSSLTDAVYHNLTAQPFIYALQYYRWQQIQRLINTPIAFAGYSLGEATAVCISCHLSFEQGLAFIQKRADLMQQATISPSGLLSVQGLSDSQLNKLLEETQTYLAIKISPELSIIGGFQNNLQAACDLAENIGTPTLNWLKVSVPSHTPLLAHAAQQFLNYTTTLPDFSMHLPIISATQGKYYNDSKTAFSILSQQIDHALDWYHCLQTIEEYQPDVIIEIGPGNALARMVNNTLPHIPCRSFDDFKEITGLESWLDKYRD